MMIRLTTWRSWHNPPIPITIFLLAMALLIAPTMASAAFNPLSNQAPSAKTKLAIEVVPGDWGHVDVQDIQRILESVATEFRSYVGATRENQPRIRVVSRPGSPRVLYERGPEDEYVVHLSARDERWYQYVYQFAHELCHIVSNFDHKDRNEVDEVAIRNQWFEESLCEAASLFTLKRLAVTWEHSPPARNWIGYGSILASYAEFLLAQPHRHLAASHSLARWYKGNRVSLGENPYLRDKNEVVATKLLRLFERNPSRWKAIAYLNTDTSSAAKPFADYLADWYDACPRKNKAVAMQAMALFGLRPATLAMSNDMVATYE